MLGRVAAVIPSIAVAMTALVLLGPGAARSAIGARLRGAPVEGSQVFAFRLEGVKSLYGVDERTPLQGLQVEASSGGAPLGVWSGDTGPDGIAEVRIDAKAPVRGLLTLRLTRNGAPLAEGTLLLPPASPTLMMAATIAGTVAAVDPKGGLGPSQGDLSIRVEVTRGFLAAPFPEIVRINIADKDNTRAGLRAELELSAPGADLSAEKLSTDAAGKAELTIKPLAHQVDLSIIARAAGKSARWEGTLPIVPGATWIAPPKGSLAAPLEIVSPSPRERAYLSFFSEDGRIFGAAVPLQRDAQGFYRGEVSPVLPPAATVLFVSVAGDPLEQGAGTIAIPLRPAEGTVAPRPLQLLIDGVPAALDRERHRAWSARRAALMVVGAAAALSMLLILLRSRASQRKLEAHLAAATEGGDAESRTAILKSAREYGVLRVLVAVAVVGLAFAVLAAVSTFR